MEVKCPLSCICSPAPSSLMINMSSLARLSLSCSQFSQSQPGASFALAVQDLLQLQIAPGFFYPALSGCCVLEGWSGLSLYEPLLSLHCKTIRVSLLSSPLLTCPPSLLGPSQLTASIINQGLRSRNLVRDLSHISRVLRLFCVCIIRVVLAGSGCSVLLTPNGAE